MPSLKTDRSGIQISICGTPVKRPGTMPARKHTKMFMFAADGFGYASGMRLTLVADDPVVARIGNGTPQPVGPDPAGGHRIGSEP
jgi:hypothetical protein